MYPITRQILIWLILNFNKESSLFYGLPLNMFSPPLLVSVSAYCIGFTADYTPLPASLIKNLGQRQNGKETIFTCK